MLLRSRNVELLGKNDEQVLAPELGFWAITDKRGEVFAPCEVILCKVVQVGGSPSKLVRAEDLQEARSYYGKRRRLKVYQPQFTLQGWKLFALVRQIIYARDEPPDWYHPFDTPVRCYRSTSGPETYKLSLPKGCIINDNGFVEP